MLYVLYFKLVGRLDAVNHWDGSDGDELEEQRRSRKPVTWEKRVRYTKSCWRTDRAGGALTESSTMPTICCHLVPWSALSWEREYNLKVELKAIPDVLRVCWWTSHARCFIMEEEEPGYQSSSPPVYSSGSYSHEQAFSCKQVREWSFRNS